jgi:hypothetical protein
VEGDVGAGSSGGVSVQGDFTYNSAGNISGFGPASGGSVTPAPRIGYGLGIAVIGGAEANVTLATPTFGQIANGLASAYNSISNLVTGGTQSVNSPTSPSVDQTGNGQASGGNSVPNLGTGNGPTK